MDARKNLKTLAWFNFFTDFKLYAPVTIIYFSQITHSFALGMSIFSIANIADALFEVPTGILSDRVGRKNTVILGAFSAFLYSLFYALGQSYWILLVGAIFQGMSIAFYSGNNDALLHDSLKASKQEHRFHEHLGKLSSLFQAALAISAIIGSFVASRSFALVMWLSVIPQLICILLSFQIVEPKIHVEKSANIYIHTKEALQLFFKNKKLRLLSIASSIGGATGEALFQFQSAFYNSLWPLWAIGIAKTLSYLGGTISFYFGGKIIDKLGDAKTLLWGSIVSKIVNGFSTLFPTVASPLLMSGTSLTYGATSVAKSSLYQKEFSPHQRATIGSLISLMESVFFAIYAFILGLVGDYLTPAKALFLSQIVTLSVTYMYWLIFRDERKNITI